MVKEFFHLIGGKQVKSRKTFNSINPAKPSEVVGVFQLGGKKEVDEAVKAAWKAFPEWSKLPAPKRGEILLEAAHLLKKSKERLAVLETKEMGKILKETRGDVQEAIDVLEYMAGEGRRLFGHTTPSELKNKFAMTVKRPLGVVGLITPWNFPIAIPAWKIAPALICGNSMVLKPSSDTPLSAYAFVELLIEAGVPEGVINIVTGLGEEVGNPLVKHKNIRGVSFTGSKATGEWITQNAGLKKIGLELGGKNGIAVMEDADLDLALEGVLWGAFGTTGQRCTACSRVILHKSIKEEFEEKLIKRTEKLKLGSGLDDSTDIGPLVNKNALEKVHKYTEIGVKEGATLLTGGEKVELPGKGFFYKPTVFTDVKINMRIAQEEIFGPSIGLIKASNIDEAIKFLNSIEYGLSSSVYTKNINYAFKAIEEIEAGITYINSSTIGAEVHLPFGGIKSTGNGTREAGIIGIDEFSEVKTVYIDYSGKLQKAQIDEASLKKK